MNMDGLRRVECRTFRSRNSAQGKDTFAFVWDILHGAPSMNCNEFFFSRNKKPKEEDAKHPNWERGKRELQFIQFIA